MKNKTLLLFISTIGFLLVGYFGVQRLGSNTMFTIAAAVGGTGAISYVLQKPTSQTQLQQQQPKAKSRAKKS